MRQSGSSPNERQLYVRDLGLVDYHQSWLAMKAYTDSRNDQSCDELWLLEHPSVFTQGQAGKAEHILAAGDIPVVQADRGGQVTYHGPGQLTAYVLIDIKRIKLGARDLVHGVEDAIIKVLALWGLEAIADPKAPGVYINGDKIASVGMRIRRGCSFHGLALNLSADLEPFTRINPCGYSGLKATRLADHSTYTNNDFGVVKQQMAEAICNQFNLTLAGQLSGLPDLEVNT